MNMLMKMELSRIYLSLGGWSKFLLIFPDVLCGRISLSHGRESEGVGIY